MFEVGKKYKYNSVNTKNMKPIECVWAGDEQAVFVWLDDKGNLYTAELYHTELKNYPEYKEPIKNVRYFNVYKYGVSEYGTRESADAGAGKARIGCKRVEFTEGEFDD